MATGACRGTADRSVRQARRKIQIIRDQGQYGIFAINNENQLWSYDLDTAAFKILGEVGEDVDHLTDINRDTAIDDNPGFRKKEVVELTLSK